MATLAQATAGAASGGQAAQLTVLLHGLADPVDAGIVLDGSMLGVHQDHLKVLVGGIGVDPVGVQHTQVGAAAADTLLGDRAQVASKLQLVDAMVLGLSVHNSLGVGALASATAHGNAVHDVALLGLVAQRASLLGASGAVHTHHVGQLTVLPCAHAQQKAEHIALLLAPDLLHVSVSTHDCSCERAEIEIKLRAKQSKHAGKLRAKGRMHDNAYIIWLQWCTTNPGSLQSDSAPT